MSHAVAPADLGTVAKPYGTTPFLLYCSDAGEARVNHVVATCELGSTEVTVTGFGRGVTRVVEAGSQLSLLWPAAGDETFSLIADGSGTLNNDQTCLTITIDAAVLHRPAPVDGASGC